MVVQQWEMGMKIVGKILRLKKKLVETSASLSSEIIISISVILPRESSYML